MLVWYKPKNIREALVGFSNNFLILFRMVVFYG